MKRNKDANMQGIVKKLLNGFGFIRTEGQRKDCFFHASQLQNIKFPELREGDKVEFDEEESPKGKVAMNILLVD